MSRTLAEIQEKSAGRLSLGGIDREDSFGKKSFPEPDFYIGKGPRWERDKLIEWLEDNGRYL